MEEYQIKQLLNRLSWEQPNYIQESAMSEVINNVKNTNSCNDLKRIIRKSTKPSWYNLAKIILKLGYPTTKSLLPEMLVIYQDTNWPGVGDVTLALTQFDKKYVVRGIEKAAALAIEAEDYGWIFGLNFLLEQLDIKRDDFSKKELFDYIRRNSNKW